ncbi:MAG: hypothetical protein J2P37_00670 [Ktedonobacteraceae bacterium]|nr:hypothetical protein [Ktedonobacteraceae bacterium]
MPCRSSMLLVGLDIGTSSVKALAFTLTGSCVAEGRASFATVYSGSARAEQHPNDWWQASVQALRAMTERLNLQTQQVAGIGLTGQCPTFTLLDLTSGDVGPGLLYQDNRAANETEHFIQRFGALNIHQRTGQTPSPFYVLPKLLWLKAQHSDWFRPGVAAVQPRDLVAWHLTGRLATEPTHAACTLAYDLMAGNWARDWLDELDLIQLSWPELLPSSSVQGLLTAEAAAATGLPVGTPVITGAADSLCAVYGAQAMAAGVLCEVTGTSTCLHLTVMQPVAAYTVNTYPHIEPGRWCAEVGLNTTGGAIAWLSTLLGRTADDLLTAAAAAPLGAEQLFFLPHLSGGERDAPERCGAFIGLQLGHDVRHMSRAVLEGVAYAIRQRVELLGTSGNVITQLISCGGASRSALWTQIKADVLGLPTSVVTPMDTTAWGAALIVSKTLNIPVTSTALMNRNFQPVQVQTNQYQPFYRRFCRFEEFFAERN